MTSQTDFKGLRDALQAAETSAQQAEARVGELTTVLKHYADYSPIARQAIQQGEDK